jgi:hypothetical protein
MSVISGTAYWASITMPNTTFDADGVYTIDICNLDEENIQIASQDGLEIKNKGDERGDFITAKTKVRRKDGGTNSPPKVVDSKLNPMAPDVLVGNGSKVNVSYRPFEWSFGNRSGMSAGLNSIQVLDLVEYNPSGSSEFDVEEGYTNDINDDIPFAAA